MSTMRASLRTSLILAWIAALAALSYFVQHELEIGTDLRLFLPNPTTPEERLLVDEIGEGAGSRVLVLALGGASAEELADASRNLSAALAGNPLFRFVANGELPLDEFPESLLPYRYLLSDTLDEHAFDASYLRKEIRARARDLASPAGAFLEPWLPRDPTLELLNVLQRWQPAQEPNRLYDVWFDRSGEQALLLAETVAPAFDSQGQRAAIDALHAAHASIDPERRYTLTVSGTGQFTVMMEQRTRGEAQVLGTVATIGMIVLMLIAYRRANAIFFSVLPLASAGLVGLSTVSLIFGTVHGITLAFGFTLIGVAQDYPVHVLSHWRAGRSTLETVRSLWPTLATGVASTCIAYLTFLFSGVTGLQQLACFTIAGLAAASLTTRFLLPRLMGAATHDYGESKRLTSLWRALDALPRPRLLPIWLLAGCVLAIGISGTPFWEDDLSKLTPIPRELLMKDQALRGALGAADVRYMLVVTAADVQGALERLEDLAPELEALEHSGAIGGVDHAARYIPSVRTQRTRQQALPDERALRAALDEAQAGTGFRADVFEPFVHDVVAAKKLAPLKPEDLRETTLGANLDLLFTRGEHFTRTFVTLNEVDDAQALSRIAQAHRDVLLLDLKGASESLVAKQRTHILWSLAAASLLLIAVVAVALRSSKRVYRVLAPMVLTTFVVLALLQVSGTSLNLFHLIALMLAAGLGLDYALFFEHAADDPLEQRRTLHAVLVCSLSTLFVFALLATSSIPVLQAIGVTVSLGVVGNFLLALVISRGKGSGLRALGSGQRRPERDLEPPSEPNVFDQRRAPSVENPAQRASGQSPVPRAQSPAEQPTVAGLIPHSGTMCLLEHIVSWTDGEICLETSTHRSLENPLRSVGRLRAVHLCEYGAQAMAVHGALKSQADGAQAAPGMLVSLRSVQFSRDYIDDLPDRLTVMAECLQASESSLQYRFRITHRGELLAEGRAAVVLQQASEEEKILSPSTPSSPR